MTLRVEWRKWVRVAYRQLPVVMSDKTFIHEIDDGNGQFVGLDVNIQGPTQIAVVYYWLPYLEAPSCLKTVALSMTSRLQIFLEKVTAYFSLISSIQKNLTKRVCFFIFNPIISAAKVA